MTLEAFDLEALERLKRYGRWTRPLMLIGLTAVAVGLVLIAVYLQLQRTKAEARAVELEVKLQVMTATLHDAQSALAKLTADKQAGDAGARTVQAAQVSALLANASQQAAVLKQEAAVTSEVAAAPVAAPLGPIRIFLHIASEDQRAQAEALRAWLGTQHFNGRPIVAPGVQFARSNPQGTLRCFKVDDCSWATDLARVINAQLRSPGFKVTNMSKIYDRDRRVQPGTIELWFLEGPVVMRDQAAAQ